MWQCDSLNPDMSTPRITLCVLLQLLMLDPFLFFALIFTCWNSNAAFLLSPCLFGIFQAQIFLLYAWTFMMYSVCFFTLQIPYFSSPPTLSCVAQSLLVPGKIPSKYGRRGSAIGIGTIEEVDIYPFHITNVIFTVVIWYGIVIILLHLCIFIHLFLIFLSMQRFNILLFNY